MLSSSAKVSLCMLIGVWAVSSISINDGWLSDDACRCGVSRPGVPDLLRGLEKLKDGLGNEATELMEGDLAYGRLVPVMGDATGPRVLLADILRGAL